jgi:hypothetical protein
VAVPIADGDSKTVANVVVPSATAAAFAAAGSAASGIGTSSAVGVWRRSIGPLAVADGTKMEWWTLVGADRRLLIDKLTLTTVSATKVGDLVKDRVTFDVLESDGIAVRLNVRHGVEELG